MLTCNRVAPAMEERDRVSTMRVREKYIEETWPRWHVFGEDRDGVHVDVWDLHNDRCVAPRVTREVADKLIAVRAAYVKGLAEAIDADYELFTRMREAIAGRPR